MVLPSARLGRRTPGWRASARTRETKPWAAQVRKRAVRADQSMIAREDALALHAEIERLPSVFRLPVVLCYFEGLSLDEAARGFAVPKARSAVD